MPTLKMRYFVKPLIIIGLYIPGDNAMTKAELITEILAYATTDYERGKLTSTVNALLKTQDRDTRHACADAVVAGLDDEFCSVSAAHAVIMNCRGGLK